MRFLKTSEAAGLLNVSPNTLRAWERRFGYPRPQRSPGRHRLYTHGEINALREALQDGLSISSAVSRAREGLSTDADALIGALVSFERARADQALEAALALRSVERSVEEVLLPSLEEIQRRHGLDSTRWVFAASWGTDWLRRAQRLSAPPPRQLSILVGDASLDDIDPDAAPIRAFELFACRSGAELLCLSVRGVNGMADALAMAQPDAVVLAGAHARDDEIARWAYAVRLAAGPLPVALFRREVLRPLKTRTTGAPLLPRTPSEALAALLQLVETSPIETARERRVADATAPHSSAQTADGEPARYATDTR